MKIIGRLHCKELQISIGWKVQYRHFLLSPVKEVRVYIRQRERDERGQESQRWKMTSRARKPGESRSKAVESCWLRVFPSLIKIRNDLFHQAPPAIPRVCRATMGFHSSRPCFIRPIDQSDLKLSRAFATWILNPDHPSPLLFSSLSYNRAESITCGSL